MKIRLLIIIGIVAVTLAGCEPQAEAVGSEALDEYMDTDYNLSFSEIKNNDTPVEENERLVEEVENIADSIEEIEEENSTDAMDIDNKKGAIAPEQEVIVDEFTPDYDTSYEGYDDLTYLQYNSELYPVEFALSELCVEHDYYEMIRENIYSYICANGYTELVSLMDSFRKEGNIATFYCSLRDDKHFLKTILDIDDGSCEFEITDHYELTEFYYGRGEIYKDKHVYCYMDWTSRRMPEKTRTDLKRALFNFLAEKGQNIDTLYIDKRYYRGLDNGTLIYYVDDISNPSWAVKAVHDESIGVLTQEIVEDFSGI